MAKIKPFKGIRPPQSMVEEVASRPYDVLNSAEARVEAGGNPHSLLHVTKAEIDLPEGTDEHSQEVYDKVVENYNMFKKNGWLVQDEEEKLYIYAQTMDGRTQYGIVACAHSEDYINGIIKKHELTRKDKEDYCRYCQDRRKHSQKGSRRRQSIIHAESYRQSTRPYSANYVFFGLIHKIVTCL
mgnify:CR=1 FL=1